MTSVKRTAVTVAAGLVLCLLAVLPTGPASGAPTWVDPADLPDVEGVTQLHVSGSSLLWVDASSGDIMSAPRSVDGPWTEPTVLADPDGAAVIEEVGGFKGLYPAAAYTVGSELFLAGVSTYTGQVDVVPIGDVVPGTVSGHAGGLSWAEAVAGGDQRLVQTNGRNIDEVVPPAAVTYLDAALLSLYHRGGDENVFNVWISQKAGEAPRVWSKGGVNGSLVPVSAAGTTASDLSTNGEGLITWTERSGTSPARVMVGEGDADTNAWRVRAVSTGTDDAAQPSVGFTPSPAYRVVTWREQRGDSWVVLSSSKRERSDRWSAPVTVASGAGVLESRQFSVRDGAVANWCRPTGAGCTVQARTIGATLGAVATLGTVEDAAAARIAVPSDASAVPSDMVAWTDGSPGVRIAALDADPPARVEAVVPVVSFTGTEVARWSVPLDQWSAVPSYRFRISDRGPRTFDGLSDWDTPVRVTTATRRKLAVQPGHTRCLGVRGVDAVGNTAAFNIYQWNGLGACVTAPLDERDLKRSKGWTKVWDRDSHDHTLLRTRTAGATLTFERYSLQRMLLLVKRVPHGGTVVVRLNGHSIGTIDTSGPMRRRTAYLAKKLLPSSGQKARTLTITVVSHGKPVLIDGVILADHIGKASEVNRLTRP